MNEQNVRYCRTFWVIHLSSYAVKAFSTVQ